jgi:outer membrane protein assembly factor BamB
MRRSAFLLSTAGAVFAVGCALPAWRPARAEDWPMWGRDRTRNMVSPEKDPPVDWDIKTGKNIKWKARLGSQSYGNTVVYGDMVFVGTNNEAEYNPAYGKQKDASCLLAFRASDGQFLWQHLTPKHPAGRVIDWPLIGVCCSPLIEDGRGWYTTQRCEVVCFDIRGAKAAGGGKFLPDTLSGQGINAAIIWKLDMINELGVFPHNATSCSIGASYRNLIYVVTGNGVDESHKNIPAPKAPSLIAIDRDSGKVVWTDNSPGENVLHGQWSSPLVIEINGRGQVIAPQGDGWIRSFDALTGKLIWKFDSNAKNTVYPATRNELIATPVYYDGRVYIANGQDPEHGEGPGHLWCIDPTKSGDVSWELDDGKDAGGIPKGKPNPNSAVVWHFDKVNADKDGRAKGIDTMHRTISTVAIHNDVLIAHDFSGYVHCLDARTGKRFWSHDMLAAMWSSPLIADGKVYSTDEDGDVVIFELSREKKILNELNMGSAVYSSPVYAGGVLYIMSREMLYAIKK